MKTTISLNFSSADADSIPLFRLASKLGATIAVVPTKPIMTIVISRKDSPSLSPLEEAIVGVFAEEGTLYLAMQHLEK